MKLKKVEFDKKGNPIVSDCEIDDDKWENLIEAKSN